MGSKDELLFIPLFISVALLVGFVSFYAFAGGLEPELTSFGEVDTSNDLEEDAEVVSVDGDKVGINGNIVGKTGGQEVVAEKKNYQDGKLTIDVRTENREDEEAYIQVLTGYEYNLTVDNLGENDIIIVNHKDGREFKLNVNRTNNIEQNSDDVEDEGNKGEVVNSDTVGPVTAEVTNYESSGSNEQNENINAEDIVVDGGDNIVRVTGSMVGSTGGQTPIVDSIDTEDNTVTVGFTLESTDGFATQVITTYEYSATIESVEDYERIVVNQKGGQSDTLEL